MVEAHDAAGAAIWTEAMVFLAATSLIVPAMRLARLSAVLAFLLIGVALGPHGFSQFEGELPWLGALTLSDGAQVRLLADMGVVFLLFVIGLEVSTSRLWSMRRLVFGLGAAQVAVSAAVIAACAYAFGNGPAASVVIGLAFALSSTAVVLQLLTERRRLAGPVGRTGFSVLLFQDLAVAPILFAVAAISSGAEAGEAHASPGAVALALGGALAAIALMYGVGKLALRPLLRWVAATESREVFVAAALLIVVGMASAAAAMGLSMGLGAFLAGLLLAETEFRHQIEADIEPFKGLLLGLFFATIGMQIDPAAILAEPLLILLGVVGLVALKAAILAPLARLFGLSWPRAIELGLLLGQAGEFAFVILTIANVGGVLSGAAAQYFLLVVSLSIFVTPALAALGGQVRRLFPGAPPAQAAPEASDAENHVVVAGYGRVGQALGALLSEQEIAHVGLDGNIGVVNDMRARGWPVHLGDADRREILEAAGAANATAIVVTMDKFEAVEQVVRTAKAAWPGVPVFARARDAEHARRLHLLGAERAVPETVEASLQLAEALLHGLGVPDEAARKLIENRREAEIARSLLPREA